MGNYKIYNKKLDGCVNIPPSKSMAHRAVICASLAEGESIIENIDLSDDIISTINGMKEFGADIKIDKDKLIIKGITNLNREFKGNRIIDCNESGSTLRFLIPIGCLFSSENNFIGRGNLGKRPLDTFYDIFNLQGIKYSFNSEKLDLKVLGKLNPSEFNVPGNISSQFITGLLFALPLLDGDSKIIIKTETESKGYIDLTLKALKDFGIEIINKDYKEFIIKGNQKYKPRNYRVEGDYSSGTFFLCADAIGNNVLCKDLLKDSLQGDKGVIDVLTKMGVEFNITNNEVIGKAAKTKGIIIDASSIPDAIPALSVVACLSEGKTEIINAKRLRIKECDRLSAIVKELKKLGGNLEEKEDSIIIYGIEEFQGGSIVWSHRDHRIAMMLSIAGTRCKNPIIIEDIECVSKSYPKFFEDFKALGGKIDE